ncbi:hypothetical protein [Limoniibacter endophyticus]|uniref:Uncharacterized protein n=1 Tax=Limoniibacter endophyticus TaxID=1565040 RepID=A0A8J3GH18_9HYPH|nr:hypothetical protein [Limoniibacter endophyticus]GHC63816.1 hypothetical protein GCM10010136_05400 [Limoniibacter endophyticus]
MNKDETFYHHPSRLFVDGGAGNDTYIFRNYSKHYEWHADGHGISFTHGVSRKSVHLINVESVKFSDDGLILSPICALDTGEAGDGSDVHASAASIEIGGALPFC